MASNKPVHSIPSATGGIARLAYTRPREYLAAAQEHNLSEGRRCFLLRLLLWCRRRE